MTSPCRQSEESTTLPLRMGVIGCGPIGMLHARAIANSPGAQLVAICEINGRRIEEAERTFDVPSYLDVTEMLAEAATDSIHAGEKIEVD